MDFAAGGTLRNGVRPLRERAAADGIKLTLTPFNGFYLGYQPPDELHERMEIYGEKMSFLGPLGGRGIAEIVTALLPGAAVAETGKW